MAEKHDLEKNANRLNQAMHDVIFLNSQEHYIIDFLSFQH